MIPFLARIAESLDAHLPFKLFEEALVYLTFVGAVQGFLTVALIAVLLPAALVSGLRVFRRRALHIIGFSTLLLCWGCLGNEVWSVAARNRLYVTPDPVVEFVPFALPGRWILDEVCGGHLVTGYSFATLRLFWFGIAAPVWVLSLFTFRRFFRRLGRHTAVVP